MPVPAAAAVTKLPGPLRLFGKKHLEMASQWLGTAATYGTTAGALVCYFTDWKVVVSYLPYYNGKFSSE